MASVSVPLHIQGASKLVDAPSVGPAMLLKCAFVTPLLDLVNAMVEYQQQHEAAPAACTEPSSAPAACAEPRSAPSAVLNPEAPAFFPKPEPKPEVADSDSESVALPKPEPKTCLRTVEDLALQALRKVENVTWERRQRIQQQVEEPCGSSRFAAYDSLRTMHKDCELCKRKEECALGGRCSFCEIYSCSLWPLKKGSNDT